MQRVRVLVVFGMFCLGTNHWSTHKIGKEIVMCRRQQDVFSLVDHDVFVSVSVRTLKLYMRFECSASGTLRGFPKFAGRATNFWKVRETLDQHFYAFDILILTRLR